MEVDVLVVGAGPAGSTTARYCAGNGVDVLMVDRRREIGYPVQCGELLPKTDEMYSIFPKSVDLESLFAVDRSVVAGECDRIEMVSPGGRLYPIEFRSTVLDRRSFDKYLAKRAEEAGARLMTRTSVLSLRKDGMVETSAGAIKAKVIVGADGPNSRIGRESGLGRPSSKYPAVTCQASGSFENTVRMYFGAVAPGGYAWVIPKDRGANIGLGYDLRLVRERPRVLFDRFVSSLGCEATDVTMGFVPISGPLPRTVAGKVLLVGDAAGHVMATNGGGIPTAMMAGRVAGSVIREHLTQGKPLTDYESRWRSFMERPLKTSLWTRKLADVAFRSDPLLAVAMRLLGRRGLERAIRCKRVPI